MGALSPKRHLKGAHYIYTTLQVQYKRLFEMAETLIKHRDTTCDWRFCRIDPNRCSGQDTGGFALAVGWPLANGIPLKAARAPCCKPARSPVYRGDAGGVQFTRMVRRWLGLRGSSGCFLPNSPLSNDEYAVFKGVLYTDVYPSPGRAGRFSFHRRVTRNP